LWIIGVIWLFICLINSWFIRCRKVRYKARYITKVIKDRVSCWQRIDRSAHATFILCCFISILDSAVAFFFLFLGIVFCKITYFIIWGTLLWAFSFLKTGSYGPFLYLFLSDTFFIYRIFSCSAYVKNSSFWKLLSFVAF